MTNEEKAEALKNTPAGALLYFPGHTMFYTGYAKGSFYALSALGSASDGVGELNVKSVYSVSVNTLDVRRRNGDTWLTDLISIVIPANCSGVKYDPLADVGFSDVPEDSYFRDAVSWALRSGITDGADEGLFMPDGFCTRSMAVTFIWRAAGSAEPVIRFNPFDDIAESDYFFSPVLWCVEKGITFGSDDGLFLPEALCTRAQAVTLMWRAAGTPEPESGVNPFSDVKEASYYYKAVLWAVENGITDGVSDCEFSPDGVCTRGQMTTFIYRSR